MERIQLLIDKLVQQKQQNESAAQLLVTVQLLQNELLKSGQKNTLLGTSKVAVLMPQQSFRSLLPIEEETQEEKILLPLIEEEAPEQEYILRKPEAKMEQKSPQKPVQQQMFHASPDLLAETPTFIQQKNKIEIHEVIAGKEESLNDRLKQEKTELAHVLKDTPVKDLRKAIGINDKFLFVNELFRGDEPMYERSIKTINNFHVLSEAEYWMNRELKVKIGWNDTNETVQHFYQIVRRRFS